MKKVKENKCCICKTLKQVKFKEDEQEHMCYKCYEMNKLHPILYIPPKGEIHKDKDGRIICHECGRAFDKLQAHIKGRHKLTKKEYLIKHRLNMGCSLTSDGYKENKAKPSVDISKVRKSFEKGHTINVGKPKSLQYINTRTGMKYKTESNESEDL